MATVQTVLCVPGPWESREALVGSISPQQSGHLFAGRVLMNIKTQFAATLDFESADPRMPDAFRSAGPHWANSAEMTAIEDHQSVAYIVGDGGSIPVAEQLMDAAAGLLRAGGLGVKVESSGVAHSASHWLDFADNKHLLTLYRAYVVTVGDGAEVYSCGMHNLGLRDVRIHRRIPNAAQLVSDFSYYLYAESPEVSEGQTFRIAPDAPVYRIEAAEPVDYGPNDIFTNPIGTWTLQPID